MIDAVYECPNCRGVGFKAQGKGFDDWGCRTYYPVRDVQPWMLGDRSPPTIEKSVSTDRYHIYCCRECKGSGYVAASAYPLELEGWDNRPGKDEWLKHLPKENVAC